MQGNKVEICGVDTSKLPVLTHKQMMALFERIHAGDEAAREEFIQGNLRLVLSVIQRFGSRPAKIPTIFFRWDALALLKPSTTLMSVKTCVSPPMRYL